MSDGIITTDITFAAELIRRGEAVGVPTETVYGLCCNGLSQSAVERLYELKGRPAIKPMALMVRGAADIEKYCESVPRQAYVLAKAFWPGPLTVVMAAKKDVVPDITRAGGDTVGLRCPNHPLTLRLLNECGLPLAGPSANPSGMPSPKTAQTVLDYFGNGIGAVLDGGDCAIGKESTIIDISQTPYQILREGALSGDEVASALVRGMDVIGITGGTGAGKSTALDILQSMGALVLDCDGIYHRLTEESPKLRAELEARFGGVYKNGKLDRKRLGGLVFGDPKALLELNAITHAHVYREVERLLKEHAMNGGTLAAVDAVALIESGLSSLCTAVFAVTAERETRIGRIMAREGIPREYAERRVDAQKNDEFFVKNCGMILENNGTKEEFAALSRAAFTEVIKNGGKEAGRSDKG